MVLRVPNLGTGNGQTGDNEYKIRQDYNHNFTDQSNAASREVGKDTKNIMEVGAFGVGAMTGDALVDATNTHKNGFYAGAGSNSVGYPVNSYATYNALLVINRSTIKNIMSFGRNGVEVIAINNSDSSLYGYVKIYGTNNTQLDSNGALKPSSPVLRVFNDRIEGNTDGDAMAATYTKNGVGDYTISGTTGLRSDGWYIVVPNDMNGNPKVAVTLEEVDGIVSLKTYARIFDMSTFKFIPDLEQPLDIPDGRWIDLRFEDLPIDDDVLTDEV